VLRECLAVREKKAPDDWPSFHAKSMLGEAQLGQKKYADAEPLLVAGYAGLKQREKKLPPPGKIRLTEAAARLVQLYEAWGKPAEAAKWRQLLAQTKDPGK
jgi:eukaryotic-like serine/threonine-protein kinase